MLLIETFMIPRCIVPFHEISERLKFQSILFVQIEPFLHFSICLWMLHPCLYMLYFFFEKESLKSTLAFFIFVLLICIELCSSICNSLLDLSKPTIVIQNLLHEVNAEISSCSIKLSSSKDKSLSLIHISEPTR